MARFALIVTKPTMPAWYVPVQYIESTKCCSLNMFTHALPSWESHGDSRWMIAHNNSYGTSAESAFMCMLTGNVLVTEEGRVYIIDLGLALNLNEQRESSCQCIYCRPTVRFLLCILLRWHAQQKTNNTRVQISCTAFSRLYAARDVHILAA